MACVFTGGYTLGCRDKIGGVQYVAIGTWNGTSMTFTTSTQSIITAFTGTTVSFYKFEQELETASFNQTGQFSTENGTTFYEITTEMILHRLDDELRNKIKILGEGAFRLIVKDQSGKYWYVGAVNPVRVSAASIGVGKAFGDMNGATITLSTKERYPAYEIQEAAALAIISA
jgi:adenylosuccinate synthase